MKFGFEGLLQDPQRLTMLLSGLGLLGSKTRDQADRWKAYGAQGLLQSAGVRRKEAKEAEARDKLSGLIGKPQSTFNADLMEGEQSIPGLLNEGTGYLGGKLTYPELAAQVSTVPGMEKTGLTLLGNYANIQPKERKIIKDASGRNRYSDTGEYVFPDLPESESKFKDTKEMLTSKQAIRTKFDDANKINNKLKNSFERTTNVIRERGGFDKMTGADDTLLMKSLANMILPTESVMSDDLETIKQQSGLPAYFRGMVEKLTGGGTLEKTEREIIYKTMASLHNTAVRGYSEEMVRFYPDVKAGGFNPKDFFMDHTVPYETSGLLSDRPKGKPEVVNGHVIPPLQY